MIHWSKSNLKSGLCYSDHRSGEHTRIIPVIYEGYISVFKNITYTTYHQFPDNYFLKC